jgi:deoxycytidylate deaminase
MIISDGFNGTPVGFENVCEDEFDHTKPYVLHAEANAITKVAQSNNSSSGATLYVTTSPCIECAKLIIQSGITRVVFGEYYRITDGVDLLKRAGVECLQLAATEILCTHIAILLVIERLLPVLVLNAPRKAKMLQHGSLFRFTPGERGFHIA